MWLLMIIYMSSRKQNFYIISYSLSFNMVFDFPSQFKSVLNHIMNELFTADWTIDDESNMLPTIILDFNHLL